MDVTVCRPGELTAAERAVWTSLQAKAHLNGAPQLGNPFLAPEFALAVARCRSDVRIAVVRGADGEPAAFFPYQRTAFGVGRAIGLGLSDCQGLVHRPGFAFESGELLRACGLSVWEFDHLAAEQPGFGGHATASFASPVIDLEGGFEEYASQLSARSASFYRTTRYKDRKLGRRVGEVRYVHDERDPAMLRVLMAWKSAQYRRTGRSDRFAKRWIVHLLHQLFHTRSDSFAGRLSVLYAGSAPVAAHFGLRSERVHTCWFPAYDPQFAQYSPGLVMHLRMAEAAAAEGVHQLDLGRGEKAYKESLKTGDLTVHEGWASRAHPVALGHRARRVPLRALRNTVQTTPALYRPADRLLRGVGALRTARAGEREGRQREHTDHTDDSGAAGARAPEAERPDTSRGDRG
ncbi:GNAT family N-acetyltransferase [Streptomyces sulphureus]|uniref:GNAT family N-acetyltransferase n=1 Tax=Streptomyces sulphureus TaxID=47758 RepID=UPI00037F385C|nr:GNAT family N-acetyltransferase [Streptomyces sulphureus]